MVNNNYIYLDTIVVNAGLKFEKLSELNWIGVHEDDNCVPVSNIVRSLWSDIDIRDMVYYDIKHNNMFY